MFDMMNVFFRLLIQMFAGIAMNQRCQWTMTRGNWIKVIAGTHHIYTEITEFHVQLFFFCE